MLPADADDRRIRVPAQVESCLVQPNHGREYNKNRTRIALATAAVKLFREKGFESTTVEEIAKVAGSSASTFFRYFGTKEDVLFLGAREVNEEFQNFISEPVPGLTRWDQIHLGIVVALHKLAELSEEVQDASIGGWLEEPALRDRFGQLSAQMEGAMAAALAAEKGVDPDHDLGVQLAARAATSIYVAAFHVHHHTGRALKDLVDEGFSMIGTGLYSPS
jgi:AcrR family transcriptional regulator